MCVSRVLPLTRELIGVPRRTSRTAHSMRAVRPRRPYIASWAPQNRKNAYHSTCLRALRWVRQSSFLSCFFLTCVSQKSSFVEVPLTLSTPAGRFGELTGARSRPLPAHVRASFAPPPAGGAAYMHPLMRAKDSGARALSRRRTLDLVRARAADRRARRTTSAGLRAALGSHAPYHPSCGRRGPGRDGRSVYGSCRRA
jgi:hypothetical protein